MLSLSLRCSSGASPAAMFHLVRVCLSLLSNVNVNCTSDCLYSQKLLGDFSCSLLLRWSPNSVNVQEDRSGLAMSRVSPGCLMKTRECTLLYPVPTKQSAGSLGPYSAKNTSAEVQRGVLLLPPPLFSRSSWIQRRSPPGFVAWKAHSGPSSPPPPPLQNWQPSGSSDVLSYGLQVSAGTWAFPY